MAGYRRFVAYVYEYPQGKKGNGKGFIKVEARDGICRMQYKLTGIYGKEPIPCKIYGYVRKNGECRGILLGKCDMAGISVQFEHEMEEENMGKSGYRLDDLCGLILIADSGEMYGSGWDDRPVDLAEIRFPEEMSEEMPADKTPENVETMPEERREMSEEHSEMPEMRRDPEECPVMPEMRREPEERARMPEMRQEPEERPRMPEMRREPEERPRMPEMKRELEERARMPRMEREPEHLRMPEEGRELENRRMIQERMPEKSMTERRLFSDNSIVDCRKITPADYRILGRRDRGLMNNKFLCHGYSNYGHLIVGRREEDGRYILGIPGVYECQESLMAGMFGFPYFKETGGRQRGGRFGYWYRLIDTPDFGTGNNF